MNYHTLPVVSNITSGIGSNAIVSIASSDIGVIKKTKIEDIGFDYAYDRTLRPSAKLPEILKIDNLAIFESNAITSVSYTHLTLPTILLV